MQVTRRRRPASQMGLAVLRRRSRKVLAGATVAAAAAGASVAYGTTSNFGTHHVGTPYAYGLQVSDDQALRPYGDRLMTPFGKMMGSSISPDGRFLAASTTDRGIDLQVFDLATYRPVAAAGTLSATSESNAAAAAGYPGLAYQKITDATVGQEGPVFAPDGASVWLSQQDQLSRFPLNADGTLGAPTSLPLAVVGGLSALPGKPAFSADGSTIYVPLNGQNTVVAMDAATGVITHSWPVGIAPREVVMSGGTLYVSDEGGRRARPGESALESYGTNVPADPKLGTSTTGEISVIDTARPALAPKQIKVGLHPTAMYLDGSTMYVANTNSDTVSVVDTRKDRVEQTIATQPWPASQVGYEPTSMTMVGRKLLVSLGRANAVAVYRARRDPRSPASYLGLLPTDYYPATLGTVGRQVYVTNTRGIDARGPALTFTKGTGTTPATNHGTHSTTASLTHFTVPSTRKITHETNTVFKQNGWTSHDVVAASRTGAETKAVAVPRRLGAPSTIKHVFLLVKENRSYDQVLGDLPQGNGDPALAQFGAKVTPNQHALAARFGLYDNFYDIGTNSAEGHNWLMQGDNPEYTESSAGEYLRSYDTEEDVLGHQRSGFLWTAVQAAGKTARDYGEFEYTEGKPAGSTWQQYYCAATNVAAGGDPAQLTVPGLAWNTGSVIPSLNDISDRYSPPFDTATPDLYRYEVWKQDFRSHKPANLNMMWLSSDHTGGPPDPEAQVADGDLAVGDIVDTISHSKYWKSSAIFVVEDDSQDGADHIDGHRAPVQVISPWAKHGKVVHTYYTQISLVRTIEQILGAQPLNQKVAAATPMYHAFKHRPDLAPFRAVPNQVPLTEGLATQPTCGPDTLGLTGSAARNLERREAIRTRIPAAEEATAAVWQAWLARQHTTGNNAIADYAHPELMNRYTWYQTHRFEVPYPGDSKIYLPDDVPGGYVPNADMQ